MADSYCVLSGCYDRLMKDFDYDRYYALISPYISGRVLECGIGSGEFTLRYITQAAQVIGIDISHEMLNIAARKLVKQRRKLVLQCEDLSHFKSEFNNDTVLAICDTFNYIEDVDSLLRELSASLNKGGRMIFDMSSDYKLREIVGNNIFYEDHADLTYIWTNSLVDNAVDMDITIFCHDKSGDSYTRQDESHRQYIHDYNDIIGYINKYLTLDFVYNDSYNPYIEGEQTTRWIFICHK